MPSQTRTLALRLLLLTTALSAHAAPATLKGVILLNEIGGQPTPNVEISTAAGIANPVVTKSNGTFSFTLPSKSPGDTVQLIIQKPGYSVVNKVQLLATLSNNPDDRPLTLLLCRTPDLEEMARRFYGLKSREAIEHEFAERTRGATAAEIAKLTTERDQALSLAKSLADSIAHKDATGEPASALYQDAMRAFLNGDLPKAISILDNDKLAAAVAQAKHEKEEAQKTLDSAVQSYLLKGQLLTAQFNFPAAEEAYSTAIAAAPESFDANFSYGVFSQNLNHFSLARKAYEHCLVLVLNPDQKAKTLNNLGTLDSHENRKAEARQDFMEALRIYSNLAEKSPDAFLSDVAMVLNNLGVLFRTQNQEKAAGQAYEQALEIRRLLATKNPDGYLPELSNTLDNMGSLYNAENRLAKAGQAYEEALKIRRQLAVNNPGTYLPDLATTLNNLGYLYQAEGHMADARSAYEETLRIERNLAEKNPASFLPDVAGTLNNLGLLDNRENRRQEAKNAYDEALQISRRLAAKDSETYLPYVAMTLNNLGLLESACNRMNEATQAHEEALKIRRQLAAKSPDAYLPDLASTLCNLGLVQLRKGLITAARENLGEALSIYKQFAAHDPVQFDTKVSGIEDLIAQIP